MNTLPALFIIEPKKDWWEELPIAQRKQILAGIKDADEGRIMDSKDFGKD